MLGKKIKKRDNKSSEDTKKEAMEQKEYAILDEVGEIGGSIEEIKEEEKIEDKGDEVESANDEQIEVESTEEGNEVASANAGYAEAENTEVGNKEVERALYIVTDRKTDKLMKYIDSVGLNVTKVYESITDARNELLLEFDPYRVVVVDTGTGKFTNVSSRKELMDMVGIMDEEARVSIIYTESALKSEAKSILGRRYKEIHWERYKGTPNVVTDIVKLKEIYKQCKRQEEISVNSEKEMSYIGMKQKIRQGTEKFNYLNELVSVDELVENNRKEDIEELPRYKVYMD